MTQEQIIGNKAIAEFMGWELTDSEVYLNYYMPPKEISSFIQPMKAESMQYHSSFDWLMPVVEKIEHCDDMKNDRGYSFHVCIFDKDCHIFEYMNDDEQPPLIMCEGETKIQATWLAVTKFISWYNSQLITPPLRGKKK